MRIPLPAIFLFAAAILAAQPDPIRDCRRQASVSTGVALADIDARVHQFLILWTASTGTHVVSGSCEADQDGRIVRFEQSPRPIRGGVPSTPGAEAIDDCRRQASISTGVELAAIDTRLNSDLILWQIKAGVRRLTGFCQVDARGRIVRFESDRSEVEDLVPYEDAEATCARAARRRLGADDEGVEARFQAPVGTSAYRIQWQYLGKTGSCVIDSTTGRLRRMEASGGW